VNYNVNVARRTASRVKNTEVSMKYSIIFDKERDEEVIIFAHGRSRVVERLEDVLRDDGTGIDSLVGYTDRDIVRIDVQSVECFTVENERMYAVTEDGRYLLKLRLYQVEEGLDDHFVRINQSCIVNVDRIERFTTTVGTSLMVTLKSGYRDYVSRRCLKTVKERIGF